MGIENKVTVNEVALQCKHCGSIRFAHRRSQLNTALMTFFGFDWLDASADVYVCADCGFLHWFLGTSIRRDTTVDDPPIVDEPPPVDDTSLESKYLSCGAVIPAGIDACRQCGWSYRFVKNAP